MKQAITQTINNCDSCQIQKYDRKPNKIKYSLTEGLFKDFCRQYELELHTTCFQQSSSNSTAERLHSTITEIYRLINETRKKKKHEEVLDEAFITYNNAIHSATKLTPQELFTGRTHNFLNSVSFNNDHEYLQKINAFQAELYQKIKEGVQQEKNKRIEAANVDRQSPVTVQPGDIIFRKENRRDKLTPRFSKHKVMGDNGLTLTSTKPQKIHKEKIRRLTNLNNNYRWARIMAAERKLEIRPLLKKDASGERKWRMVVDYRKLNEKVIKDRYPMPLINDVLDSLGRAKYFSTLDLASGYHQIEVKEEDIPKTAFSAEGGHFEYVRMPFGLNNAPATFQRLMNNIFGELLGKCCLIYMDDIMVYSTSLQEHVTDLEKVFKKLAEANFKLQLDKTEFLRKEVEYLGHVVTQQGIRPNPGKIEAIKRFEIPKTRKQIKSFLGL